MLTSEYIVSANMNGDSLLRRSSWKAQAIRRGELKISGPIPIVPDLPQTEEAESHIVDQPATDSTPAEAIEERSDQPPYPGPEPQSTNEDEPRPTESSSDEQQRTWESYQEPMPKKSLSGERDTNVARHSSLRNRDSQIPSTLFTPAVESSVKAAQRKKRKSGIRHVFRKMFGRRSRAESDPEEEQQPTPRGHSYHKSDPGLARQSAPRPSPPRQPRISDLIVKEPRFNPLGSHLPFPMNVNAPQGSNHDDGDYLTFEAPSPGFERRRRATLPSVLVNPDTRSLDERMPPMDTWDDRRNEHSIPSPQIGIALSSPSHAQHHMSIHSRRRSRSAGALRELAAGQQTAEKRRSAEIRYWRNSVASGSIYSQQTQTHRPRTAQTSDTAHAADVETKTPSSVTAPVPALEGKAVAVAPVDSTAMKPSSSVEAFNFGDLQSGFSADQASQPHVGSDDHPDDQTSIQDRSDDLAANLRSLETSVQRISGRGNRHTFILETAPKGRRSRAVSANGTEDRPLSQHSSAGSIRNGDLPFRRAMQEHMADLPQPIPPKSELRPTSKRSINSNRDTVINSKRDYVSSQTAPASAPVSIAQPLDLPTQVSSLTLALAHERSRRKALELHVRTLQYSLSSLNALVQKLVHASAASPHYPTPSPDAITMARKSDARHDADEEGSFDGNPGSELAVDGSSDAEGTGTPRPHNAASSRAVLPNGAAGHVTAPRSNGAGKYGRVSHGVARVEGGDRTWREGSAEVSGSDDDDDSHERGRSMALEHSEDDDASVVTPSPGPESWATPMEDWSAVPSSDSKGHGIAPGGMDVQVAIERAFF